MSIFKRKHEQRSVSYQDVWGSDSDFWTGHADFATFVPVFAATRLLCDAVAQTPLYAYAADGSGRLSVQPQFLQRPTPGLLPSDNGAYDWLYKLVYSLLIRGNAYGYIVRPSDPRRALDPAPWPGTIEWLDPTRMSVLNDLDVGNPVYLHNGSIIPNDQMLHIPAFPIPGRILGLSPIKAFATTTEIGQQAMRFGLSWFRNNGNPGAILQNQKLDVIDPTSTERIKSRYKAAVADRDLLVLGRDWSFESVSIPAEESQFLATIKATANQVAAIYGVPPERIGGEAASSRSYSNLDMDLRYLRSTSVAGWLTQIEQAFSKPTISPANVFCKFDMDAGIRSDTLTRMQTHDIALRTGIETIDEARAVEDKPPLTPDQMNAWMNTHGRPTGAP